MDIDLIWQNSINSLKNTLISPVGFNIYLKDAVPLSLNENIFTIAVAMSLNKTMIENRYKAQLEKILSNILQNDITLNIEVNQNPVREQIQNNEENTADEQSSGFSNLNPKYTFDNYIIGSSNEYAAAAAIRAAENPGQNIYYNPLFLYGSSGVGKTHLMHAIGNSIKKNFPEKKVIYVTSEQFTNDFIDSVRKKTPKNFRQIYRCADVLLIDDIQFLEKKESTQDELFHTFNELYNMNKQIVLTSDRIPEKLITLEDRLKTRFKSGPVIDISAPSFETRVAILKNKSEQKNIYMDEDVYEYIADCIQSNVRELEGALLKLISYSQIKEKKIDLSFAKECLQSYKSGRISVEKIIDKVCVYYDITKDEIISKNKTKNLTLPRQVAMYLCNILTELNYGAIAKNFGNRDRTTVLHNVEKIKDEIKTDAILNADVECILKDLKNG